MTVKVYSTPTCPYCKKAKEYLSSKGVSFQDIDVSTDKAAADEMVKISGQMGVPVIVIAMTHCRQKAPRKTILRSFRRWFIPSS